MLQLILSLYLLNPRDGSPNLPFDSVIVEQKIIQAIKNDFSKMYATTFDSLLFLKANSQIEFKLTEFEEPIISNNYLSGFSFSNSDEVKEHLSLIRHVEDSLKKETNRINKKCQIPLDAAIESLKRSPKIVYFFFSPFCDGKIYVRAIHSEYISMSPSGNSYDIYGLVYSYLFEVSNNEILKWYKGTLNYN